jgi:hypothetical protein
MRDTRGKGAKEAFGIELPVKIGREHTLFADCKEFHPASPLEKYLSSGAEL